MEVRYLPDNTSYQRQTTEELRSSFLVQGLFKRGDVSMIYCDTDRAIAGGAVPLSDPLPLLATKKEMSATHFTERREVGIVNIGGKGMVRVGEKQYPLGIRDMLYVGKGDHDIAFSSVDHRSPATFYFVSYPAHASFPVVLVPYEQAMHTKLGAPETCNERTINKYIHGEGAKSCQLVMGLTDLASGSVWNTMPPHTHQRRMEIYLYFSLAPDDIVVHLMGRPEETRSLIMRNQDVVLSPSWSIHCAAATRNYSFVWAMGGENQEFGDMDAVEMTDLR